MKAAAITPSTITNSHHPEINQTDRPVFFNEEISGMRIGMKEAIH
jgi:hypothetical protein